MSEGIARQRWRVVQLIDTPFAHPYLVSFAAHGDRQRFDYRFASLGPLGPLHAEMARLNASAFALSARSRKDYPLAVVRLARYLRTHNVDVLQAHLLDPCLVGLAAAAASRVPVRILTGHHVAELQGAGIGSRWAAVADRATRKRLANHVVVPTESVREVLAREDRRVAARTTVIPHGIELDTFVAANSSREALRRGLGIEGGIVVGCVGRISPVKNLETLLRAFAAAAAVEASLQLVFAGSGDPAELKALARQLGVEPRVHWLGWRDDIHLVMQALDFVVHAAVTEAFGFAIVESLAAGTPVVSTPVGIAPAVVEEGVTGVLLADCRQAALTDGILRMLSMRERWPAMASAGRERSRRFSASTMVARHEQLYESLLSSRHG